MLKKRSMFFFIFMTILAFSPLVHAESYYVGPGDLLEISVW